MTILAVVIDAYTRDWLDLLIRSLHVIAAIGWIGSSFYFVLLDQSLRAPEDPKDVADGVGGELWEVHGGGFYHVKKYKVAPPELPGHLAWFKWEAYATWLSGFSLLVVLYWLDAKSYLIDRSVADIGPWTAVGISAGLLVVAWVVYDVLCRTIRNDLVLAVAIAVGAAVAAYGTAQLYAPRAAWLQVGAMLGTIMAGSVFFNIIPAHWELIRAKEAGRDPDPAPGIEAKRRSVHNNYFTLPVLLCMLAGHFSFLTGHQHAWMILVVLMGCGALVRHFYNLRHQGRNHWWMPAAVAVVVLALAIGLRPDDAAAPAPHATGSKAAASARSDVAAGRTVFEDAGCVSCHTLKDAAATGKVGPNLDQARPDATLVIQRVTNGQGGMPPFSGSLSTRQIEDVAAYVAAVAGSPKSG